jgi:trk system potassium uptake protein TrkH
MIDFRPAGHAIGWLVALLGVLMLLPAGIDAYDRDANAKAFLLSALVTATAGAALALACGRRPDDRLGLREGFALTAGAWVAFSAFAALPLMLGAPGLNFTRAMFETMSAMTTTGATVIGGLETQPRGLLLWRGMLSFLGGLGVVLLAMILLPVLNVGGMQLLRTADFNTVDKVMPRAKDLALTFGAVYLGLNVLCALFYAWSGLSGFDAAVHAMTTVATGGMANYDTSFVGFGPATQIVGIVFMLLGAMSFVRYVQLLAGDPAPLLRDSQIRTFLALYLALSLGVVASRLMEGAPLDGDTVRAAFFNMASVLTTTGYASADYAAWGGFAGGLFFCAMMVCGCSGSTSGGPKVFRYQILLGAVAAEIRRLHSPNAVITPRYQGAPVSDSVLSSVMGYFMLFFLTLGIGAVALVLIGLDPVTAITGAAATLTAVGPGLGPVIGPAGSYAPLPDVALWIMTFLMFVGRLELLTVYVLFTRAFWRA